MCEDIQADVEDGQLQFFYILAFVLRGDVSKKERPVLTCVFPSDSVTVAFSTSSLVRLKIRFQDSTRPVYKGVRG